MHDSSTPTLNFKIFRPRDKPTNPELHTLQKAKTDYSRNMQSRSSALGVVLCLNTSGSVSSITEAAD